MTNGEKLMQAFPDLQIDMGELEVYMWTTTHDAIDIPLEWWNAEYKEPTADNDSAVDCIVDVLGSYTDLDIPYKREIAENILTKLPSVTTIRPKGHWIEQIDHEENCRTLICSNCDRPALHDGDSIWKHKFCPHCGADMREVGE